MFSIVASPRAINTACNRSSSTQHAAAHHDACPAITSVRASLAAILCISASSWASRCCCVHMHPLPVRHAMPIRYFLPARGSCGHTTLRGLSQIRDAPARRALRSALAARSAAAASCSPPAKTRRLRGESPIQRWRLLYDTVYEGQHRETTEEKRKKQKRKPRANAEGDFEVQNESPKRRHTSAASWRSRPAAASALTLRVMRCVIP
jgi:hypothetical protein